MHRNWPGHANLQAAICFALDSLFDGGDDDDFYDDPQSYMYSAVQAERHRIDQWLHKPMINMYPDLTLLCFDFEGVEGITSELGYWPEQQKSKRARSWKHRVHSLLIFFKISAVKYRLFKRF